MSHSAFILVEMWTSNAVSGKKRKNTGFQFPYYILEITCYGFVLKNLYSVNQETYPYNENPFDQGETKSTDCTIPSSYGICYTEG